MLDALSAQTEQELAALAPPAVMSNTGMPDQRGGGVLAILGVACALAGAVVRRSTAARRRGGSHT